MRRTHFAKMFMAICMGALGAASQSAPRKCLAGKPATVSSIGSDLPCALGARREAGAAGEYGGYGGSGPAGGYGDKSANPPNGSPSTPVVSGTDDGSGGSLGSYGRIEADAPVEPQSRPSGESPVPFDACADCQPIYSQCGGGDLTSSVCCEVGLSCVKKNAFYGQCLPPTRAKRNISHGWDGTVVACGSSDAFDQGDVTRERDPRV